MKKDTDDNWKKFFYFPEPPKYLERLLEHKKTKALRKRKARNVDESWKKWFSFDEH